uniref:Nidogen n=1 Tax=Syphacia muris TaxID=451379 RepID=A0A0N5ASL2_9BILA
MILGHRRYKRQFDGDSTPQIDLNVTVPFIFSARLYPYGEARNDRILEGDVQKFELNNSLLFLGQSYNTVYIRRDGAISFSSNDTELKPSPLPIPESVIAVYWMPAEGGTVYFRETNEQSVLNLAQNEVNIQYHYGSNFVPKSVLIVTWKQTHEPGENVTTANLFQASIIISDSGTFAHFVYSKLNSNNDAVAGFVGQDGHYSLPESGTYNSIQLAERSDIGIPGEFLFRIDSDSVFLCGAGFKGAECIETCDASEWGLDCVRRCHCKGGTKCNSETGICPGDGHCNPGWIGEPICEDDIDECASQPGICPIEQPDCLNTPGAYLCICYEYDNVTNSCKSKAEYVASKASKQIKPDSKAITKSPSLSTVRQQTAEAEIVNKLPEVDSSTTAAVTKATTVTTVSPAGSPLPTVRFNPVTIRPLFGTQVPQCQCGLNAECIEGICQCKPGWTGNGKMCVDINECSAVPSVCGAHSVCDNTAGSYRCQCDLGYINDENGRCVDMDECAEGVVLCGDGKNDSICVNTDGGFECRCAPGYVGHPESLHGCVDINECENAEFYCGDKGVCKNTIGGYECDCAEGYGQDPHSGLCTDIDECKFDPCDKAALCTNLAGTFKCTCIDGYVGNGLECHETKLYPIEQPTQIIIKDGDALLYQLEQPVELFMKDYDTIYVTLNGGITFKAVGAADSKGDNGVSFFPLMGNLTLGENGRVSLKIINELYLIAETHDFPEKSNDPLLIRSSLNIASKFYFKEFRTRNLILVSYDKVEQAGFDRINSYQVLIAQGDNGVFVTYLYEELETEGGICGFHTGKEEYEIYQLPFELVLNGSNIGDNGIWIFRVDKKLPILCPSGTINPPLCQRACNAGTWGFDCENKCHCKNDIPCDFGTGFCSNGQCSEGWSGTNCFEGVMVLLTNIDECMTHTHKCSVNADCINEPGSFRCKCKEPYIGDGYSCKEIDGCHKRFNERCSVNAKCMENGPDGPQCVCNKGYYGDGLHCLRITTSTEAPVTQMTLSSEVSKAKNKLNKVDVGETPFLMNNWITDELEPKPATTPERTRPTTSETPLANDYNDIKDEYSSVIERKTDDSDGGNMWFIIGPVALCGFSAILMAVLMAVCCCKRRLK